MEKSSCCVCQKPKATLQCGLCESPVCKYCAQFLDEDQFSFIPDLAKELRHSTYCGPCYDARVAPELQAYEETMQKARNITVFFNVDSKQTRNFKRTEKPFKVRDCADREEALLRLAFLAVQGQFNALIDVDIVSEKIREGSYQTTKYHGTGMPAQVTSTRFK